MCAAQSELAMLRAEVRALADNLKDAENRVGLQVSFDGVHASLLSFGHRTAVPKCSQLIADCLMQFTVLC